jgi:hypothetical protein
MKKVAVVVGLALVVGAGLARGQRAIKRPMAMSVAPSSARSVGPDTKITYYSLELGNAQVEEYEMNTGEPHDLNPVETVLVSFERLRAIYTEVDSTGSPRGTVEYEWRAEG